MKVSEKEEAVAQLVEHCPSISEATLFEPQYHTKLGDGIQACNLGTLEVEEERSGVQVILDLN